MSSAASPTFLPDTLDACHALIEQQQTLVEEEEITYRRQKQRRDKDARFPDHLPREVQTFDVPEAERACPCCGDEMPIIDTDVREKLEFVPVKLVVHELHFPKRACGKCKQTVKAAWPPEPDHPAATLTSGSRYEFGVTAQTILGKVVPWSERGSLQSVLVLSPSVDVATQLN